jgi:hypothetical protein
MPLFGNHHARGFDYDRGWRWNSCCNGGRPKKRLDARHAQLVRAADAHVLAGISQHDLGHTALIADQAEPVIEGVARVIVVKFGFYKGYALAGSPD